MGAGAFRSARLRPRRWWGPFRVGCLTVVAAALLYYSFGPDKPTLLAALDHQLVNAMFRWRGPTPATGEVVIVDIDEKSLAAFGQWPWPRNLLAELVEGLDRAGVRSVGLDLLFAEPDRTSPSRLLRHFPQIASLPASPPLADHDQELGRALAAAPSVLGYYFQTAEDGLKDPAALPFPSCNLRLSREVGGFSQLPLFAAYRPVLNVLEVAQAQSEGFINVLPDASGTIRKVPLLMGCDGLPYPSLALEVARLGLGLDGVTLEVAARERGQGLLGLWLGERFVATDDQAQVSVNFRGPARTLTYLSAADLLAGRHLERVRDKFVLIGTSAAGLHDLRATPFSRNFPGVEIHATVIDNLLAGDVLRHDRFTEIGLTYVLVIGGGLLLSLVLALAGPLAGGAAGLASIAAWLGGAYHLGFLHNQLVGVTYPALSWLAVFVLVTLFNYVYNDREKRFIQKAFGQYVSPQVVSELVRRPDALQLRGETRAATVLFSDIRGFTRLSENLPPEALGAFMSTYLSAMSEVVMEGRGMVDKFIGDAVMALWGAPLADDDHAFHGVGAALAMVERLALLNRQWRETGQPEVAIGIGVNSGLVQVGNFGSRQRFDYTAVGDNVNLASRLEGLTKLYGTPILVSEATFQVVRARIFCRPVDRVRVKGRAEALWIYQPLCLGEPAAEMRREVEAWAEALDAGARGDFQDARERVAILMRQNPQPLYQRHLERLDGFLRHPPPDWDGAWSVGEK